MYPRSNPQLAGFVPFARRGPSSNMVSVTGIPGFGAACVHAGRRGPARATEKTSLRFEHPRQPYESWWSTHPATCRSIGVPLFQRPCIIGMDLHNGAVQRDRFQFDLNDLLSLELFEHPVQHPAFRPTAHPHINSVPPPEPGRQPPPLAAVLRHIQNSVQHLQIRQLHIAPLGRETMRYPLICS